MMTLPIPTPDPMPLPAPVWLLKSLLLLTFFLHLVLMNFAFGGAVIALVSAVQGKRETFAAELSRRLRAMLPVLVAFTITLGVAALLFVQVLYGNLLYASSILVGAPWLSVIPLLIIAYYAIYVAHFRKSVAALGIGVAILLVIAFIYVNNMSLMLTPERWSALYAANVAGTHFNFGEHSLLPRYLHMVLSAFAIGGLLVVALGVREPDSERKLWMVRRGGLWFTIATIANVLIGFWFLATLPARIRMMFIGGSPLMAILLLLAVSFAVGAVVHLLLAATGNKIKSRAIAGIASGLAAVASMVVLRGQVRTAYLSPHFSVSQLNVSPQWSVIGLFLVLFVGGLLTLAWMLRKLVVTKKQMAASAAAQD